MRTWFALLAILLTAAACAPGNVRLYLQDAHPYYSPGDFAYAAAGRDLHVVVVGNPFGSDQAAFGRAVTDAMQGRHWGQRTNFTTTPGPDARIRYRVVLLFDPPVTLSGARLCRRPDAALPTESADGKIELYGAFCRGKKSLTEIKGRIAGATGPDDPAFRELVGQVTNGLFSPDRGRNGDRENGCQLWMSC